MAGKFDFLALFIIQGKIIIINYYYFYVIFICYILINFDCLFNVKFYILNAK